MKVYIVTCNDKVSSKGFSSIEECQEWLEKERGCVGISSWMYRYNDLITYRIHEITI